MKKEVRKKICESILSDHKIFSDSIKRADSLWKDVPDSDSELSKADEEEFFEIIDSLIFQHEMLINSFQEKDNE